VSTKLGGHHGQEVILWVQDGTARRSHYCGADATGSFNRDEFGLGAGKDWGFKMEVGLRVQVEGVAKE
jgi:polyisoprenoid-binding protein YceI